MTFEVYKDKRRKWRFRIVADNGQIIAPSEDYSRKIDMMQTIRSIQKNAATAEVKEIR